MVFDGHHEHHDGAAFVDHHHHHGLARPCNRRRHGQHLTVIKTTGNKLKTLENGDFSSPLLHYQMAQVRLLWPC